MTFTIGDMITTTVHTISGGSAEVSGVVCAVRMSVKTPGRVLAYDVDAAASGYGRLTVDASKARAAR